jgi:hypothetical protein
MEEWEIIKEKVFWEDWEKIKSKAQKSISEILDEKNRKETFAWAMERVKDTKLKNLEAFWDQEKQ